MRFQQVIRPAAAVLIATSLLFAELGLNSLTANAVGGYTSACATEVSIGGAATSNVNGRAFLPAFGLQGSTNPRTVPVSTSPDPMSRVSNATGCTTPWTVSAPVQDAYFSFPALPQGMSYADGNSQITIELSGMTANSAGWYFYPLNRNSTINHESYYAIGWDINSSSTTNRNRYLVNSSSLNQSQQTLTFTATAQQVTDMNNGYLSILVADAGSQIDVGNDTVGSLKVRRHYTSTPSNLVTFVANDGSGTISSQWDNSSTPLSPNTFSRSGYTFEGWALSEQDASAGIVAYQDEDNFAFTSDATLYAVWAGGSSGGATNSNTNSSSTAGTLASTGFRNAHLLGYAGALGLTLLAFGVVLVVARRIQKNNVN